MGQAAPSPMSRWIVFALALALAGCQTFDVRTDWDPTQPLGSFQRYVWLEPPEVEGANPFADNTLLRKRLRAAIESELAARGFSRVDSKEAADFQVTYSVILEEQLRVDGYATTAGGYGYPSRYVGFGSIYSTANVRNYQESTLIIDFLNVADDDLVWRGWGTGIVSTRDRDRGQARLEKGVRAVLDRFPPEGYRDD